MPPTHAPFHPIIYVRGYAMSRGEIDDTTADPFCGFNLGSTVYRATPDKKQPAKKHVFESPVVRLGSDFGYADVFVDGLDISDPGWETENKVPIRSIVIYRYYEQASTLLGTGKTPSIESFAQGLSDLVLRVRDLVCANPDNAVTQAEFRCYLVAHSMGGLVCRAFLQNPDCGKAAARACVDKFFTYATPHNGIELAGINVPAWLTASDLDNFNHKRMKDYLDLKSIYKETNRVDWMVDDQFPVGRVFCMVGTNRADYEAAMGLSRAFAGHGSDGLVRLENASVWGIDREGKAKTPCATAYTYRSHSGYFGIVNSEEAYQNLTRFLFGDVRVDLWADVEQVTLPPQIADQTVEALYQFEVLAAPRGKRWFLTRRTAEEDSVACRTHRELTKGGPGAHSVYLSTVFLADRARVDPTRRSLAYSLTFGVRVPDYEIDRRFWFDGHFEGRYLYRESFTIEIERPAEAKGKWKVGYFTQSENLAGAVEDLDPAALRKGKVVIRIPFKSKTAPGIEGSLRLEVSGWNA